MPVVAAAAAVAGASMAAVPPTLGFIAKEAGFEALTYLVADGDGTGWPAAAGGPADGGDRCRLGADVAYTLRFWWGAFTTAAKYIYVDPEGAEENVQPCRPVPWGFAAAPVLLAALSLAGASPDPG